MRKVRWSDRALRELDDAIDYIAYQSPAAARSVLTKLRESAAWLGDFPTGRRSEVEGIFEKVVARTPYLLVYSVDDRAREILILRVFHTARDRLEDDLS